MFTENFKSKWFYFLLCPVLFVSSIFWLIITQMFSDEWFLIRTLGGCFFLAMFILWFVPKGKYRQQKILICCLIFGVTRICPIEISLKNSAGSPHFVPLVAGMATEKAFDMAQNGEAILNGCLVSGFEPKWVLVW